MPAPIETPTNADSGRIETLAYDEVARSYREGLVTRLRGFQVGPAFLDAWVDDEDVVKAVFDVFDAARAHGLTALRVTLEPDTAARFDRARFAAEIARLGTLAAPDDATLEVRFEGAVAEAAPREVERVVSREAEHVEAARRESVDATPLTWSLTPAYASAVAARADRRAHEGPLALVAEAVMVHAQLGDVTLRAAVNPSDHRVREARYEGAATGEQRALLEALCETLAGVSLREASDHAVIRVEAALRDRSGARPVAGIVLPENASPGFRPLLALARGLLADYRAQGHDVGVTNFETPSASPAWAALEASAQAEAVQRALDAAMAQRGYDAGAALCLRVAQSERVTLSFSDAVPSAARPSLLMALERVLKADVEATLHVYLEERKDLNKLRRL